MHTTASISAATFPENSHSGEASDVPSKTVPLFLSILCHWWLFGVLCSQISTYISRFPKDRWRNKLFVYTIVALEIVQTVLLTKDYLTIFGYQCGTPQPVDHFLTFWLGIPIMSGIIAFLAQGFYAMRVHALLDSYPIPIAIFALSVIELCGAIANGTVAKRVGSYSRLQEHEVEFAITSGVWLGAGVVCDIVIAYSMSQFLWRRRDEGVHTTRNLINSIIRRVVATGTLTAIIGILGVIVSLFPTKRGLLFAVPTAAMSKLYSNSLLALMNYRQNFKPRLDSGFGGEIAASTPKTTLRFAETFLQSDFSDPMPETASENNPARATDSV